MTSINNEPSRTASDRSPAPAPAETETTTSDNEYPPQLHAGAVGYGPDYGKGAVCCFSIDMLCVLIKDCTKGFEDKLQGLKEELKGKMLHKPELIQHGHELRTGEAKKQADVRLSSHASSSNSPSSS